MEDLFSENQPKGFKQWIINHQVGLLGTVAFHLVLLVIVLIVKLSPVKDEGNTIYLELLEPEATPKTNAAKQPQELQKNSDPKLISQSQDNRAATVRNVAVNSKLDKLTDKLVDDKFGKSNPVYEEARKLEERMKANQQLYKKSLEADKMPASQQAQQSGGPRSTSEKAYKGASVLSYSVEGRQGTYLPVPAYLCEGGGDVVVNIVVNQRGTVVDAAISARTTASECLFSEALKAARRSRFTMDEKAPSSQKGSITYRFVAQ